MSERYPQVLRLACLILAGLLVYQLAQVALRWNPLARVTIPALPTLSEKSNDVAVTSNTNTLTARTNATTSTNHLAADSVGTSTATNATTVVLTTNSASTNEMHASAETAFTNANVLPSDSATNAALSKSTNATGTNATAARKSAGRHANADPTAEFAMASMNGGGMNKPGKKSAPLPPATVVRISRITDSEIFASVMHPMPAALMGIAGKVAFLRSASGQTGMVKEGDSLGELKLIRIGLNRVLVESDGTKRELTMFNGFGGESLLSKTNDVPHEPITPSFK